jgi:hypothetical protein
VFIGVDASVHRDSTACVALKYDEYSDGLVLAEDCTTAEAAPVLPVGYVVSASRIADRRMILAGYRLADLLTRLTQN